MTEPIEELQKLKQRSDGGELWNSSRTELTRFGALLCMPEATRAVFSQQERDIVADYVRTLLIVRNSEEGERRALKVALRSLRISFVALLLSAFIWFTQLIAVFKGLK